MKLLKKEMNRRDFLKFSLTGLFLLGIASLVPNFVKDKKANKNNSSEKENNNGNSNSGYGNGVYGG